MPAGDEGLERLRVAFAAPTPLTDAVLEVVGFEAPDAIRHRFLTIGQFVKSLPLPPNLARLTIQGGARKDWLTPFINSVIGDVYEGLTASYYHLERIESLEHEIISRCLTNLPELDAPASPVTTGVGIRRINFEYQAFRFALRRTVDYLAVGVAAFFKCKPSSINDLSKALRQREPSDIRELVCARLEPDRGSLVDVLEKPNVRDRIAHWEAVDAGVLNTVWYAVEAQ